MVLSLQPAGKRTVRAIDHEASRTQRDAVNAKVMADPRFAHDQTTMPFDGTRLIHGGFDVFLRM